MDLIVGVLPPTISTTSSSSHTITRSGSNIGSSMQSGLRISLENITLTINSQFKILRASNIQFESYFDSATRCRRIGDQVGVNHYSELARREKLNIQNNLGLLKSHLEYRDNLNMQGHRIFPSADFSAYYDIHDDNKTTLGVSNALLNNRRYNI